MGHQFTMPSELPFMNWMPSDHASKKLHHTTALYHQMEVVSLRSGTSKSWKQKSYIRKWPECPWSLLQVHYISSPSAHLRPHREFPTISGLRKRMLRPDSQTFLHNMSAQPESRPLQHYSPFLGHPWRTIVKEILPVSKTLSSCTCLLILVRRSSQTFNCILNHGLWPRVWFDGKGLRRNIIEKLVTRRSGREVYG